MHGPRAVAALACSLAAAAVLVATVSITISNDAGSYALTLSDDRLAVLILCGVVALAALVPPGVLSWWWDVHGSVGLTVAGIGVLLPLWAASPELDVRWRTLALAVGPLAVAGLALMARSWTGVVCATSAGLLHALAYDPFFDQGCALVCLAAPALAPMSVERLSLLGAAALLVGAGFIVAGSMRRGGQSSVVVVGAGALLLAGLSVARWILVGDNDAYGALLLAAVPVPGLVAVPAVGTALNSARRRWGARRLVRHLARDPEALLKSGIDVSLLTPGQQLAVRNARLAHEAAARLAEVQASQRRIVAAADAERRRIERDLHDGVQQRLVGVLMHLSGDELVLVEDQVRRVLADLRTFSRGIFPPVLEDEGLVVALEELAATSDAEIRLDVDLEGPVPPEHARALYALISHAHSAVVDVRIRGLDDCIEIDLVGDTEIDVSDVQDRFGALGGTLTDDKGQIRGRLPCAW